MLANQVRGMNMESKRVSTDRHEGLAYQDFKEQRIPKT